MIKSLRRLFARSNASPVELHPAQTCPECGSQLARTPGGSEPDGVWRCPNPDCPPAVLKRLVLWVSPEAMDIKSCDANVVAQLVNRGLVRDPAGFYKLKLAELASLEGVDDTRARVLRDEILASKGREAWRVLLGLGIPGVGAAEAQTLCRHFPGLAGLFATGHEQLLRLEGVPEPAARSVTHWYGDPVNRKLVRQLGKAGVNLES